MARPSTSVFFAFNLSQSVTFDWQDVTSYVRSVNISRGISRELEDYSAGQATVVLSNRTRAFDPTNVSSPFYGLIEPAGALKVVTAGVTVYQGFIDSWSFGYEAMGTDATATVSASDALGLLAKIELDDTDVVAETTGNRIGSVLTSPSVSWIYPTRLGTGLKICDADTVVAGTNALTYLQQVARNEPGDLYANREGQITFVDNQWTDAASLATSITNFCKNPSVETNINFWTTDTGATPTRSTLNSPPEGSYSIVTTAPNKLIYTGTADATIKKNTPYNASFYFRSSYSSVQYRFYIKDSVTSATLASSTGTMYVGSNFWARKITPSITNTTSDNPVYFELWLSPSGATSGSYNVDAVSITEGLVAKSYFDGSTGPTAPSGQVYTFAWTGTAHNSTSTWTTAPFEPVDYTTVTYFSDSSGTAIKVQDIGVSLNSENLFNDVSLSGYSFGSATDSSRQNVYGIRSYSFDQVLLTTDEQAQEVADYWLAIFKDPEFRADTMSVQLNALGTASQGTVLGLDLRSQVNLSFTPIGGGSAIDKLYSVIGMSHDIDAEQHIMTFNLSSLQNQPFRLDNAIFGVLDSDRLA